MKKQTKNLLDEISAGEAFTILKTLVLKDKEIAKKAKQLAKEILSSVDSEEVAEDLFFDLNTIDVEDLLNSSGGTRYGYIEPCERAGEMFEEALGSFLEELKRYQKLSMHNAAKSFCKGILKGLYKFKEESTTEYADYVVDEPEEYFTMVLNDWEKPCKNLEHKKEMREFIKKNFAEW